MRKFVLVLIVALLLAAGAWTGRRGYLNWSLARSIGSAREAIVRNDVGPAAMWLRRALQYDSGQAEAIRLMGDLAERAYSPDALYWRRRLVEVEPGVTTNRYALARVSILHRDYDAAKAALDGLPAGERSGKEYCRLAGAMALASGHWAEAESQFRALVSLDPSNPSARLNLALIGLQHRDETIADGARRELEALRSVPEARADALRHLTHDALRRTNWTRAVTWVRELAASSNSVSLDRILELDVLSVARPNDLPAALTRVQGIASASPQEAYELGKWMLKGVGPARTLDWLRCLEGPVQTNLPVTMVVADAMLATASWAGLQAWVESQEWAELEFLRFGFLSRALREQSLDQAAKATWMKSLQAADGRIERLRALQRVVESWSWVAENEEVLWKMVERFPGEKAAVVVLSGVLQAGGKTRSLLTLYSLEHQRDPGNSAIKNNLAAVALLLTAMEVDPHRLAREAFESPAKDPGAASTHAFSLLLQNRAREALEVMHQLPRESQMDPSVAGYYGLVLAAVGQNEAAQDHLKLAMKGSLLPEEQKLFERALR